MPIRHCQKCGLKVLIDESQTTANPFYCQRCTSSMKGAERDAPAETPAPSKRESPAKPSTVKVQCPYCKASFNGRMPQKPARGACPVCQKELILLPNGDIKAAAGFDVTAWHKQYEVSKRTAGEPIPGKADTGTKLRAARIEAAAVAVPATPVPATAEPAPGEGSGESGLPSWLDEEASTTADKPLPADKIEGDSVVITGVDSAGGTDVDTAPVEPLPAPAAVEEPPSAAEVPVASPTPAPKAGPAVSKKPFLPKKSERVAVSAAPTGGGKVVAAFLLLILPVIACPALHGSRDKLKATLEKVGIRFSKGFYKIYEQLYPPAPPPAPPPEEKKPEPPPDTMKKPGPEEQKQDEAAIIKVWEKWRDADRKIRQLSVGATDEQKVAIEKAKEAAKKDEDRLSELCDLYKKIYGKEFDPRKQ